MAFLDRPNKTLLSISTGTILKVLLVVLGVWVAWYLREIFVMLLAAILLAALIEPFADWLARHRWPRAAAVIFVYAALVLLVLAIVLLVVPLVIAQMADLFNNFSFEYQKFISSFDQVKSFSVQYGLQNSLQSTLLSIQDWLTGSLSSIFTTFKGLVGGVVGTFIVLVLAFYLVVEEAAARNLFKQITPLEYQPFLFQLFLKIQKKIGAWLRAQLILGLIVGSAVFLGLTILGVDYAIVLALLAGLLEIVPYVGPIFSLIPAAMVGFAASPLQGILVLALYFVIQQIENHILVPKVMQKVTGLNPVIRILALLIGIKLAGFVGGLLAIPVAIMLVVILDEVFDPNR